VAKYAKPVGRNIYLIRLAAAALALLVATASVKAQDVNPSRADLGYKDGIVDFNDFAILASNWGQTGQEGIEGDLNEDGVVDFNDVRDFAFSWGETYIPIRDSNGLNDMRYNLDGRFFLINDVNAHETFTWAWEDGQGFEPIGSWHAPFTGVLNGNGHYIKDIYINKLSGEDAGFFGVVGGGALITNFRLKNMYVECNTNVGTLAGVVENAIISQISTSGKVVLNDSRGGGLVGEMSNGTIANCSSECEVTGGRYYLGGLVGDIDSDDPNGVYIINSYSNGIIIGTKKRIGGLVGRVEKGVIDGCFATGIVDGEDYVGALVGENKNGSSLIDYCFFTDSDPNHDNGYGTFVADVNDLYKPDHAVYVTWDPNIWKWHQDTNDLPTLRGPEELEEVLESSAVYDDNDMGDAQSNNAPTQMNVYEINPEEAEEPSSPAVYGINDMSDAKSNNAITPMLLYSSQPVS